MLENVALVESKEHKLEDTAFRKFKLTATVKKQMHLANHDVDSLRISDEGIFEKNDTN